MRVDGNRRDALHARDIVQMCTEAGFVDRQVVEERQQHRGNDALGDVLSVSGHWLLRSVGSTAPKFSRSRQQPGDVHVKRWATQALWPAPPGTAGIDYCPFHKLGRSEPTQLGLLPLPDLSEISLGVGFRFRYQMLPAPAEVDLGDAISAWMSESDSDCV